MSRSFLFVSNGNGEAAIADRIAESLHAIDDSVRIDHLALVGRPHSRCMHDVGPTRAMPSGGLIAMGNIANIVRDVRGGLLGLTVAQYRFLRASRGNYEQVVAVGDVFALLMARVARARCTYVGTAKSVHVAGYGNVERRVLARAERCFVRDEPTARWLRERGIDARAPGNVIVDLADEGADDAVLSELVSAFAPVVGVFPGSRAFAYDDARYVLEIVRHLAVDYDKLGALISIAPSLDVATYADTFARDGWEIVVTSDARVPFSLRLNGRTVAYGWRGPIGAIIAHSTIIAGQAGTANEAAAASGVPVVAFERAHDRKTAWYRMRQTGLLGDALAVFSGNVHTATREVRALIDDAPRRVRMGSIGRERMGAGGGARAIAHALLDCA